MNLKEVVQYLTELHGDIGDDYKFLIAGHPGEIGTSIDKSDIVVNHEKKTVYIYI